MGIFGSSEENIEQKTIDSNGQVNNNIVIQEARDTHSQMLTNEKLLWATYLLCAIEIVKITTYVYLKHKRNIKRKYGRNVAETRNAPKGG